MPRPKSLNDLGAPGAEGGLNQHAYQQIRRRILDGELRPSSPLSEHQLAVTLQLSRTPVREALKRLEKEGLVRSIPSRGTFITELTAHDILEIYQVRECLESLAARIAAEQMSPSDIQAPYVLDYLWTPCSQKPVACRAVREDRCDDYPQP
ncbi:GntR family transcriptional regulator [Candidatus Chloroploca sp. Khr17]|uniref:GntR family transcriptional regulator n=1 Tax=Candidatus Chloroploca sp. Khr17 TaxID=2496869 RepID=UPI00101C3A13|nr:GntR family transcriptional regulator [Candidatus Chloroploca sp. Khr17]